MDSLFLFIECVVALRQAQGPQTTHNQNHSQRQSTSGIGFKL